MKFYTLKYENSPFTTDTKLHVSCNVMARWQAKRYLNRKYGGISLYDPDNNLIGEIKLRKDGQFTDWTNRKD